MDHTKICKLRDLYRAISALERRFERLYDLNINEVMLLCTLRESGCMTSSELAEQLDLNALQCFESHRFGGATGLCEPRPLQARQTADVLFPHGSRQRATGRHAVRRNRPLRLSVLRLFQLFPRETPSSRGVSLFLALPWGRKCGSSSMKSAFFVRALPPSVHPTILRCRQSALLFAHIARKA